MGKFLGIHRSDKPEKKYYALFEGDSGREKKVYFGDAKMKDYTLHSPLEREARKRAYISRHRSNENWSDPESPGALSRWILWNKTSVSASVADYKRRFGFD